MKHWWIISILLIAMILPVSGCALVGGSVNWQQDISHLKSDIYMFSKLSTRIALKEAKISKEDVELIQTYLIALRDFLATPGNPNFDGARMLVWSQLPDKYHIYGLSMIDVLERYINNADPNVIKDNNAIVTIIYAGIEGALAAVREFYR